MKDTKKEILKQFFNQAMENDLGLILDYKNKMTGEVYYTVLLDYYSLKEKIKYIEENYTDDLEDSKCNCNIIIEFYLIDTYEKGSDFIC